MKPFLTLAAIAALVTTLSSHAEVIDAKFSGTVSSQQGTAFAVGAAVGGEFTYDTGTATYLSFKIAGQSVAPGFVSSADFTPDMYSAFYRAQVSPVPQGGSVNSTFAVDLEGLNAPWSASSPVSLLSDKAQLAGNLDKANSVFSYYTASADGTNIKSVTASIESLAVSAVPEPATSLLFLAGATVLGLVGSRRKDRASFAQAC